MYVWIELLIFNRINITSLHSLLAYLEILYNLKYRNMCYLYVKYSLYMGDILCI